MFAPRRMKLQTLLLFGIVTAWLTPQPCDGRLLPGERFQVNTYTAGEQTRPLIAPLPEGGFVIAWRSRANESEATARARQFDSSGSASSDDFPLEGVPVLRSIVALEERLIVAYDTADALLVGSFDLDGNLLDQRIADERPSWRSASLATSAAGDVVLAWDTFLPTGLAAQTIDRAENDVRSSVIVQGDNAIKARRFEGPNLSASSTFVIDATSGEYPRGPRVANAPDDSFVVAWFAEDFRRFYGRRFDAGSMQLQERFLISDTGDSGGWDLCSDRLSGDFVFVWQMVDFPEMQYRRFSGTAPPSAENRCTGLNSRPSATCLSDNSFGLVGYAGNGQLGIRVFDRHDRIVANALIRAGSRSAFAPDLPELGNGDIVLSWYECSSDPLDDPMGCDIFAQVFSLSPAPDCPGDCNFDRDVKVDELITSVDLVRRGESDMARCPAIDNDSDCVVSINELILGVGAALRGCR